MTWTRRWRSRTTPSTACRPAVFTRDVATAHRVAARLHAGQVQVNRYAGAGVEIPFGGYKNSGLGREKGVDAMQHYTQVKSVIVDIA